LEDKRTQRLLAKYGAKNLESLQIVETVIMDLVDEAIRQSESIPNTPDPEEIEKVRLFTILSKKTDQA